MTNEQLCALAKQGDANALNLLLEKNFPFVQKTAYEVWSAQWALNQALQIERKALAQEGLLGLWNCVKGYDSDRGNLFLTYAAPAIRNAMLDYIRSTNAFFEARKQNDIISLDEAIRKQSRPRHDYVSDTLHQTPEQIYLVKERYEEVRHALDTINPREARYLEYRFGFEDEEHPLTETADHFHLSESRARSTEKNALYHVRQKLP